MYKSLQCGRACAALLVVLFHLGGVFSLGKYFAIPAFGVPFAFGHAGVHFFFVLSGFIIFSVHRRDLSRPDRLLDYLRKRAVRIYPIYWIIFLAVFGLALASPSLRSSVPHDPMVILDSLLLVPQDPEIVGGTGAPVLIVAWSLQYELLFYLSFALAILNRWLGAGLVVLVLAIYLLPIPRLPFPASLLQSNMPLFFLSGALIAFFNRWKFTERRWPALIAGTGVLGFVGLGILESTRGPGPEIQDLGYGLASALMIFGFVKLEDLGVVIGGGPFIQLLGAASYALYLIHFPLISLLCKIAVLFGHRDVWTASLSYLLILGCCLGAAIALHRFVERPILRFLRPHKRLPSGV